MKKKKEEWYEISFLGGFITALYGVIPPIMIYADNLGVLTAEARMGAVGGMIFVAACAGVAKRSGKKLFSRYPDGRAGFTLIEILIVISIIGLLAAIIYPVVRGSVNKAYLARTKEEFHSIALALDMLALYSSNGAYPPDANRGLPPGIEQYLAPGTWPAAPWPGSVYDWDNWAPSDLTYDPKQQVYQISVRFCPLNQPDQCQFPNEPWAANFDYYSSAYYCISGPCRAHSSQPLAHPAYCVNC